MKKQKSKKTLNKEKILTRLAIYATIITAILVSFFLIKEQAQQTKSEFEAMAKQLNQLNEEFEVSEIVLNGFENADFDSLQIKCEISGWELFENDSISSSKYNQLKNVQDTLRLTDREAGTLLNSILNITGNPNGVRFHELTIGKVANSSRVSLRFVYTINLKSVLSIDKDLNEALQELGINLPNTIYVVNDCVIDVLTKEVVVTNISYNNLNLQQSQSITSLLNVGKEEQDNIENFAPRLLMAMNDELNSKTATSTTYANSGLNYIK